MQSKNKRAPTHEERSHIERIKRMSCGVCDARGPSDAHELVQGQWFTSIPLCQDCHTGSSNGWHGCKNIWNAYKVNELTVLNDTIQLLLRGDA